jgi:hypothetical protein
MGGRIFSWTCLGQGWGFGYWFRRVVTQLFNKNLGKFIKCVLTLQNFINKHTAQWV